MNERDDQYQTISKPSKGLYKEKGSKFIGYAIPVNDKEKVKQHLAEIKQEHRSARHHCYAYRLGNNGDDYRTNDDGEPSGTAGKPILGQLQSFQLTNVLIIVVRYFGGTKLGTSGLIRAYRSAAKDALNNAVIIQKQVLHYYEISFDYTAMSQVMNCLRLCEAKMIGKIFEEKCFVKVGVSPKHSPLFEDKLNSIDNIGWEILM